METPKEYYYTYYSYEEWGRGYFGSRKCKCLPEEDVKYFGTFKDKAFRPTEKIILKDDYATREEAYADEIILQRYYKVVENPHFANRAYQTSEKFFYIPSMEEVTKNAIKGGMKAKKLGLGIHGRTNQQMVEDGRNAGKKSYELGVGIHGLSKEELSAFGKKGYENGLSKLSKEELSELGKKGGIISGKKCYELGVGIWGLTAEQRSGNSRKGGKEVMKQRWQCTETGYISNAASLARYQKARGIDTTRRKRVG